MSQEPVPLSPAKLAGATMDDTKAKALAALRAAAVALEAGDVETYVRKADECAALRARGAPLMEAHLMLVQKATDAARARTIPPGARPNPTGISGSRGHWVFAGKPLSEIHPPTRLYDMFRLRYHRTPAECMSDPKWDPFTDSTAAPLAAQE